MMLPVEKTANIGNDGGSRQNNNGLEAVMGSTASGSKGKKTPLKAKKSGGKKKAARRTVASKPKKRATLVKKKTAVKKKATSLGKSVRKKTKKKSAVKKTAKKTTAKAAKKSRKPAAKKSISGKTARQRKKTGTPGTADSTKSLSWMAAQAASALKAVRANQSERAQTLIAKAEITPASPAKPRPPAEPEMTAENDEAGAITSLPAEEITTRLAAEPLQTDAPRDGIIAASSLERLPPEPAALKVATPFASTGNQHSDAADQPTAIDTAEEPTLADAMPERVISNTTNSSEQAQPDQTGAQPAAVISAASTASPVRKFLIPGIILLIGILGVRSWLSDSETPDVAVIPAETVTKEPARAIAATTEKQVTKQAKNRVQADSWTPTAHPGWPASGGHTQGSQATVNSGATTPQGRLPQQETAVAPRTSRPVTVRPGYYAPAYGYYPQQPYRQPMYSRPSYLK